VQAAAARNAWKGLISLSAEAVALRPMTPEVFAAYIKAETEKWGSIIRATGARAE
jgi:tripartite-type tricarboxylate transporter receptor subunit TctC